MGSLCSAVENVEFERHASEDMIATSAAMQGFRVEMEDHHTVCLRLPHHRNHAFIGLYDGHSGSAASEILARQFWREVDCLKEITKSNLGEVLKKMDEEWSQDARRSEGSTVIFAIIERPNANSNLYKVLVGWAGDSRAFAVKSGELLDLSVDHKPSNDEEKARIEHAGGWVTNDRVDGELALSRSFGDWNMKDSNNGTLKYHEYKVSCILEFMETELKEGDCLLLSCDGLTEQLENKDIFDELQRLRKLHPNDADIVVDGLMQRALVSNSKDNMSTILVELRSGVTFLKRDLYRKRTCRPGPLVNNLTKSRFFDAYIKNIKSMGLHDCVDLRLAAYQRDLVRAKEELDGNRKPQRANLLESLLANFTNLGDGDSSKPTQVVDESKSGDDKDDKLALFQKQEKQIKNAEEELKLMKFDYTEELKKVDSAFGGTEFLLKPDHENYMSFIVDDDVDEKSALTLDEDEQICFNTFRDACDYSVGELVRVTEDKAVLEKECEKFGLVLNEEGLQKMGKEGRVLFLNGAKANVRFENLGESNFPLSVLTPLVVLPKEVKQILERVCKEIIDEHCSNKSSPQNKPWALNMTQVRVLIGIIYPKMSSVEVRELSVQWKNSHDISQAGVHKMFREIQSKSEDELVSVIGRLREFLDTRLCGVQIGTTDDFDVVYIPFEKSTFLDIVHRVCEREKCDLKSVVILNRGTKFSYQTHDLKNIIVSEVVVADTESNKRAKIFVTVSNSNKSEALRLDDKE